MGANSVNGGDEMTALAERKTGEIARPLNVLVPLIKQDFEGAEKAGMAYFKAAGEKLWEACKGSFSGKRSEEFYAWADRTFGRKTTAIKSYMALADAPKSVARAPSLEEFKRKQGHDRPSSGRSFRRPDWYTGVSGLAEEARRREERIRDAELTRQQERDAERALALRLIDIGYKVLAKELHPDMGGSRDAMTRLHAVRDRLKAHA
jgi:hypothetical protein